MVVIAHDLDDKWIYTAAPTSKETDVKPQEKTSRGSKGASCQARLSNMWTKGGASCSRVQGKGNDVVGTGCRELSHQ